MTNIKCKFFGFCAFLMLTSAVCLGVHSEISEDALRVTKAYVTQDDIVFDGNYLLIADGQNLLHVKTLHQDGNGMYYYYSSLYGRCPNGHPYTADGGCLGYNCPYN